MTYDRKHLDKRDTAAIRASASYRYSAEEADRKFLTAPYNARTAREWARRHRGRSKDGTDIDVHDRMGASWRHRAYHREEAAQFAADRKRATSPVP